MYDPSPNVSKQPNVVVTLALVSAVVVPQIGVGMSVPSLPSIAEDFRVSISSAQGTLIVYMVGYALSMLVSGLLSDRFGPRRTQLWGLGLAGAAAILAALADNVTTFYGARFIQALGGCVGTVTTRLIVSRGYDARDRMKILTTLASAIAITPCLVPLVGGALLPYVGWRGVFTTIAPISFGTLLFFLVATRGTAAHTKNVAPFSTIGSIYLRNIKMPRFGLYAAAISFVWMSYFTFVSCSSGPLQVHMRLSALHYGIALAFAAIGYVSGSMSARRLSQKKDIDDIIRISSFVGFTGGVLLIGLTVAFSDRLFSLLIPVIAILFATGMTIPATQAGLLKYTTQDAGISSGFFFFIQMIAGASYAALGNTLQNMTPSILATLVAIPALFLPFVLYGLKLRVQRVERTQSI
ncbi:Bicyclomycin resistance protein [Candidatus Burkholderia verschuerenii]|uniref:Bicyclomycin resistance protein n=1 Tax=Candidatus Burkholderia verschuerenii TaxID=242163 RepID=A0A0L0M9X5_9BURK|nr:MFS transporter [Candidatus Burkholderia verschuerenii]KND59512.1 Bicyclomycin resistance protein [Candidatus Burkholderia verschuerenii]